MTKKAPDLSAFDAVAEVSGHPNKCTVHLALEELPPDKAEAFRAAMAGQYTHIVIAKTVTSWGHKISSYTVSRHRKGECNCGG